jgi:hypothetical protein
MILAILPIEPLADEVELGIGAQSFVVLANRDAHG